MSDPRHDRRFPPLPGETRLQVVVWSLLGFATGVSHRLFFAGARSWGPVLLEGFGTAVVTAVLVYILRAARSKT
jgi:hypothetical protein